MSGTSGFLRRHRTGLASACVVLAAAGAVVAYALAADGYQAHHADLNDGGVWVTKASSGQFGRLNKPVDQLDGAVYSLNDGTGPFDIDVLQDGAAVVADDRTRGQVYPLDTASLAAHDDTAVPLPGLGAVAIGGGTLAMLDGTKGTVRAMTFDPDAPLTSLTELATSRPIATVGTSAALTVGTDGTVFAVSPGKGLTTVVRAGGGFARPRTRSIGALTGDLSITAVGDTPIVLQSKQGQNTATLTIPGVKPVPVASAQQIVLQQAGPAADAVLVATAGGVDSVALSTGTSTSLFTQGTTSPAAPVRLAGCVFAAWQGTFASSCSGGRLTGSPIHEPNSRLEFRVNRNELLLNDVDNGNTWNVDTGVPRQVADWKTVTRPTKSNTRTKTDPRLATTQQRVLPPKAVNDEMGARPGVVTPLYVLDNDHASAPGQILAIDSVIASGPVRKWLSISPDGQTVDIALPTGTTADTSFQYVVRAAKGAPATATVLVHARTGPPNHPPTLRTGFAPRTWAVPVQGTITIPVLSDWRDYTDGDPVVLATATATAGRVAATSDGAMIYTATNKPGKQTVTYTVDDGHGGTTSGKLTVDVQAAGDPAIAAVAEPDYVKGEVGRPISLYPLDNDLPGSDPLHLTATLQLAGSIADQAGAHVAVDPGTGQVTISPTKQGSYTFNYQVAYGSAPLGHSSIRVDVVPASNTAGPTTAPDVAVVHGQYPVSVDVLSNDADPAGRLLAVQRATASDPTQLGVAVIGGRFLRLQALSGHLSPSTQTVDYVVSDGVAGPVHGQVTVSQLPAPADDTPITLDDYATVRAGASVAIPVLDNDTTPAGDALGLATDVSGAPGPGRFTVSPSIGAAYVSGRFVRYVAPASVRTATTVTVDYVAQNEAGDAQQIGYAQVTITPPVSATNPDQPPTPADVEARTVAGDTVTIKIPTTGVDPDGDPVTVVGIGSAPRLGAVLSFTASSIVYQSFPDLTNGGTDTFDYVVADSARGLRSTATVRVAVVQPGDPQPPVAVDDSVTVAPGSTVRVDPLANDLIAPDDVVTIAPLNDTDPELPTSTARLLSKTGPIQITAGSGFQHPVKVVYEITDGLNSSRATVTVRNAPKANLPPQAFDQYAHVSGRPTSVRVNLLRNDFDPDSSQPPTVVSPVSARGGTLTVQLAATPQVIPYVIRDAQGATASAVVFVPASGAGLPYAKPGARIDVPYGKSVSVDVRNYVVDPAGRTIRTTVAGAVTPAPAQGLGTRPAPDQFHLVLTAGKGYTGPAAVTFQVTEGRTLGERGAITSNVTVPVQVGDPTAVLRCPQTVTDLIEGGPARTIPVATLCHVWTPAAGAARTTTFTGVWTKQPAGVSLSGSGSTTLSVQAGGSAHPGDTGTIAVGVSGSKARPQTLGVHVVVAPALVISPPIVVDGAKADVPSTIDIRSSVQSPFGTGAPISVVGKPTNASNVRGAISASGSKITVTPGHDSSGTMVVDFVATDVSDTRRTDRQVSGQITLHVAGHPDTPTGLQPGRTALSTQVSLTWNPSNARGATPLHYVVSWTGPGSGSKDCGQVPACTIGGLTNGHAYSFRVTAVNPVGSSAPSAPVSATPDTQPNPVSNFVASKPQDQVITLTWTGVSGNFSPVQHYDIVWSSRSGGGGSYAAPASARSYRVTGLDNDATYSFTIVAQNRRSDGTLGYSSLRTASGVKQSAGVPDPNPPPTPSVAVTPDTAGGGNDESAVLTGFGVAPNGPGPVTYSVTRTWSKGGTETFTCSNPADGSCQDPTHLTLDGSTYSYSVVAANAEAYQPAAHRTRPSAAAQVEAAAQPSAFQGTPTLTATSNNYEATLDFDAPPSHGASSTISCTISNGRACENWNPDTTATSAHHVHQTITGFDNGSAETVTLTECNGSSGANHSGTACNSPVQSASVTTYGPLGNPNVTATPNGQAVNWSVSVDPNGKPATVTVVHNGHTSTYTTGTAAFSTSDSDTVGYSQTDTISVTVSDPGRTSTSGSASARTPDPPTSISAHKEGRIVVSNGDKACTSAPGCYALAFELHNFATGTFSYTCLENSSSYYTGRIRITDPNQSFDGKGYCVDDNTGVTVSIVINGYQGDANF